MKRKRRADFFSFFFKWRANRLHFNRMEGEKEEWGKNLHQVAWVIVSAQFSRGSSTSHLCLQGRRSSFWILLFCRAPLNPHPSSQHSRQQANPPHALKLHQWLFKPCGSLGLCGLPHLLLSLRLIEIPGAAWPLYCTTVWCARWTITSISHCTLVLIKKKKNNNNNKTTTTTKQLRSVN